MNIVDPPGSRKVHTMPMPKTGGISLAIGALVPVLLWVPATDFVHSVLAGAGLIVCFGLKDDIRPMGPFQKLIPQVAAGLIVILWGNVRILWLGDLVPGTPLLPGLLSIPLTLLVILGITNAVNLADGLDGLAGGISILSFIMIAFLAHQSQHHAIALMAVAVVGGIAGFLRYNTHPAMLFMGDAGSQLLGFLSIVFAIALTQCNTPYSRILSLPLIGLPILDTLMVMTRRIRNGQSPFSADKTHFHHRLIKLGFHHTESVLIIYLLQSLYVGFALVFRFHSDWVLVSGFCFLSGAIVWAICSAEASGWLVHRGQTSPLAFLFRAAVWIRLSFGGLKYGFPLVLLWQTALPAKIPGFLCLAASGTAILTLTLAIGACCYPALNTILEYILRLTIYLIFPLVLYLGESVPGAWVSPWLVTLNNLAFLALVISIVMTMNLTRRTKGFWFTPMDILVCIVVLVLPNLPSMPFQEVFAKFSLAKALVLFFSFDLITREVRGKILPLTFSVLFVLLALVLRGTLPLP
jgi:UDP-GlcNAc:undecaprenyl-phosphate GlcNAc-1-phosphate transferase